MMSPERQERPQRQEKDDARLVSQYLDSLVERRRGHEGRAGDAESALDEVLDLGRTLASIDLPPSTGLSDRVWAQAVLRSAGKEAGGEAASWRRRARGWFLRKRETLRPVTGRLSALSGAFLLVWWLVPASRSGADVLARSEAAMRALIRPGELLLRRTRTEFTLSRGDEPLRRRVELSELWIDGSSPSRQIERITDQEGRLQSVILTARDRAGAGWRYNTPDFGRRYFSASDQTRLRNTLEIPPGLEALQAAAAQLRSEDRARVEWIRTQTLPDGLARQRHLNRSLFSFSSRSEQGTNFLPQVTRLEQVDTARGEPIYRVETLTQRALWGDPALGPSDQQPGKLTGVRDISRENYLTAKYDRRIERDDGSVVRMVSETLELRATPKASLDDPFAFEAPATARRVERAALEETRRLAEALRSLGLRLPPA